MSKSFPSAWLTSYFHFSARFPCSGSNFSFSFGNFFLIHLFVCWTFVRSIFLFLSLSFPFQYFFCVKNWKFIEAWWKIEKELVLLFPLLIPWKWMFACVCAVCMNVWQRKNSLWVCRAAERFYHWKFCVRWYVTIFGVCVWQCGILGVHFACVCEFLFWFVENDARIQLHWTFFPFTHNIWKCLIKKFCAKTLNLTLAWQIKLGCSKCVCVAFSIHFSYADFPTFFEHRVWDTHSSNLKKKQINTRKHKKKEKQKQIKEKKENQRNCNASWNVLNHVCRLTVFRTKSTYAKFAI